MDGKQVGELGGMRSRSTPSHPCSKRFPLAHQVMALLGMSKPGPELGKAVSDVMEWQLAHPQGSLQQVQEHLTNKWRK